MSEILKESNAQKYLRENEAILPDRNKPYWDWAENAKLLLNDPETAVKAFGYEWLTLIAKDALLWDSERKRLANAVVKVIGTLDEVIKEAEEIVLHDVNYVAIPSEIFWDLEDALEEMPKRAQATKTDVAEMPLNDINPDCLPSAVLKNSGMPILNKDEISLLARFKETTEDDSTYDLSANEMQRLAEYGAVRNNGGGHYSITEFGQWLLSLESPHSATSTPETV